MGFRGSRLQSFRRSPSGKRSGKAFRNESCERGLDTDRGLAVRCAVMGLRLKDTPSITGYQAPMQRHRSSEDTVERQSGRLPTATFGELPGDALLTAAEAGEWLKVARRQ